ncbi:MAG: recombinase family protein [Clostridia bacterium]|nr:recombinase family protein [Clostridia bacterium]
MDSSPLIWQHADKIYIIYLRKSRADLEAEARGEGETLARHRRALTELAKRNGHTIVYIFEEIVSGDTISSRPEMQKLLSIVESGRCAGVYVNDVDRLARGDSIDQGVIKQAFYSTGTLIITPLKTYDPSNIADEDFFDFNLFMARFEYKIAKRRLQTGRMRSASEGNYLGSRPVYGYERVKRKDRPGWTLEPIPEKAEIVRSIFHWYAYGDNGTPLGADSIARRLNDLGLRTYMGAFFDGNGVRCILRNPIYIGQVSWAKKVKRVRLSNGIREEIREKNHSPIVVENAHPAIIDRDLWNKVQGMFETHAKLPKNNASPVKNVLSGLIRCTQCGRTMLRREGGKGRPDMLTCKTHGCPTTGIYIPIVEGALLDSLEEWVARYSVPSASTAAPLQDDAPVRAAERQLAVLNKQMNRLHDLVEQGVYTIADFIRRRDDLAERIQAVQNHIYSLQDTPSTEDIIRAELPQIRHVLESYPLTSDLQAKNELLRSVISRVDYSKTHKCMRNENPSDFLELTVYPKLQK